MKADQTYEDSTPPLHPHLLHPHILHLQPLHHQLLHQLGVCLVSTLFPSVVEVTSVYGASLNLKPQSGFEIRMLLDESHCRPSYR
ncbi:hypothetical protein Pcinc_022948 [Petrolisthes cinctipes]|uniref:Uncharacterized protein n=1 Tax=Petrolisthes cinctipes TaxID=88211 RepID=A0AAE1FEI3_PETCI|nr:hypothetical protein Pcinc_022948 [Petrolisthes cinctipes]